jgi:hypothetical protein
MKAKEIHTDMLLVKDVLGVHLCKQIYLKLVLSFLCKGFYNLNFAIHP